MAGVFSDFQVLQGMTAYVLPGLDHRQFACPFYRLLNPQSFEARGFKYVVEHIVRHLGQLRCRIFHVCVLDRTRDHFGFRGAFLLAPFQFLPSSRCSSVIFFLCVRWIVRTGRTSVKQIPLQSQIAC